MQDLREKCKHRSSRAYGRHSRNQRKNFGPSWDRLGSTQDCSLLLLLKNLSLQICSALDAPLRMAGPAQVALPGTLKGNRSHRSTKTADVPVMQSNKFEVVIRAQTARTLGLSAPPQLLAIANQLIE